MNNSEITEAFKERLIPVFKDFDAFCKKNSIHYLMAWGTLLGCVRHKGFIPWDDDIDVYMLRDDYNRFLALKEDVKADGYEIRSLGDKDYFLPFAKFIDTKSTVWQEKRLRSVIGVYIDVFPMDLGPFDEDAVREKWLPYKKAVLNYIRGCEHYSFSDVVDNLRASGVKDTLKMMSKFFFRPFRKLWLKKALAVEQSFNEAEGDALIYYNTAQSPRVFRREWLENTVELEFEGMKVLGPAGYDEIMTINFGDWRQLPPEEKRVSHHGQYYINLKERLTLCEAAERKKKGESIVL